MEDDMSTEQTAPDEAPADTTPAPRKGLLLNRANLELVALASTDENRGAITGLYITPTRTVATDGHCLGMVDTPAVDAADFPAVEGFAPSAEPLIPCVLPADAARTLLKNLKRSHLPILEHVAVDVEKTNRNGTIHALTTDLDTTTPVVSRHLDADAYPAINQVMPTGKPAYTVAFDAVLLARVLQTIAKVKGGKKGEKCVVKFDLFGSGSDQGLKPLKITGTTEVQQTFSFLIMPCRL